MNEIGIFGNLHPVLIERVIYTQFRVVTVTNDLKANPEYQADTEEFPHLVEEIEDELETFVVDVKTGDYCLASEFFFMNNVKRFTAEVLPDE